MADLRCSPALDAVKIRCRSRRTSSSTRAQSTRSQSSPKSRGPFTTTEAAASNVPAGADVTSIVVSTDSPDPRGLPFGPGNHPYPAGSTSPDQEAAAAGDVFPVAFRRTGVRFSGHPVPAQGFRFPHGRPTGQTRPDPDGVSTFHMHETRTDWAPSVPRGRWCSPGCAAFHSRHPPLFSGQSLISARSCIPSTRTVKMTRHQPRVHSRSPARPSPHPWPPEGRNEDPSA
jgi:hypothetical protein